jgi:hypothetical protein
LPSYRWLLRARWSRSSCGLEVPRRICSSVSGFYPLLKLVLIDLVVNLFYGRCSPGFSFLFRGLALFVLRAPYVDPRRCATSSTSPALQVPGSVPRATLYRFLRRGLLRCVFLNHVSSIRSLLCCAGFARCHNHLAVYMSTCSALCFEFVTPRRSVIACLELAALCVF